MASARRTNIKLATVMAGVLYYMCVSMAVGASVGQAPECGDNILHRRGGWTTIQGPEFPTSSLPPASEPNMRDLLSPPPQAIESYAIDPGDPDVLFATNTNSIMRSPDGGCTWERVFGVGAPSDSSPLIGCDQEPAVVLWAAHPACGHSYSLDAVVTPTGSRVYAQLSRQVAGFSNEHLFGSLHGETYVRLTWILMSEDRGETWELLSDPAAPNGLAPMIGRGPLFIAPSDPDVVYIKRLVPGVSKLFVSLDAGQTWEERGPLPGDPIFQQQETTVHPRDPEELWDSFHLLGPGSGEHQLYSSNDGGQTWRKVDTPGAPNVITDISVTNTKSGQTAVAVSYSDKGVYVSGNEGGAWTRLTLPTIAWGFPYAAHWETDRHLLLMSEFDVVGRFDLRRGIALAVKTESWQDGGDGFVDDHQSQLTRGSDGFYLLLNNRVITRYSPRRF